MKNKSLLKIIVGAVAVLTIAASISGCVKKVPDNAPETGKVSDKVTDSDVSEKTHDENGYLLDALPSDLNYNGADISILGWHSEVTEFEAGNASSSAIDSAVYNRNKTVEARLGVKLKFNLEYIGNNNEENRKAYAQHLESTIISGSSYDIVSAHMGCIATAAINGLMEDMGAIEDGYLNYDNPWWNSSIIDETSVGNTFYFCTGDASTSFAQMVYCVYFNADKIDGMHLDSPYDLVDGNEWTYETMIRMGMNVYHNNNNDAGVDLEDDLPLIGQYYDWPALLEGCGIQLVAKDASGAFVLTDDIKGAKSIKVMGDLADFIRLDGAYVATDEDLVESFMGGRALFYIVQNGAATRWSFSNVTFNYGCVPMPKYNSYQTEYRGAVRKPITLFGMPHGNSDEKLVRASAVLECYGSEGYRQTTPVIFDQVMKGQESGGAKMSEMLELIRDTASFDVGRIYSAHLNSLCDMPGYYLRDGAAWENYINQKIPDVEVLLAKLSDDLISVAN